MRAFAILWIAISAVHAGVLSRDWEDGKLTLRLYDGVAEIEWISGTSFRFSRGVTALPELPIIKHDPVALEFEDTRSTLKMRSRYMTLEVDKATATLRVNVSNETISTLSVDSLADDLTLHIGPLTNAFGLAGPGDSQRFFFTSSYGVFVRTPRQCAFDLNNGVVQARNSMELIFYYGSTPKEIFSLHQRVTGRTEITAQSLHLPSAATLSVAVAPLPDTPLDSWDALSDLVQTLNRWSLSAVLYPTLDLSTLKAARGEITKRAADLAAMVPLIYGDAGLISNDTREAWTPYLVTYLREAYDQGYPLIRPLPFEFSRTKLDPQPTVFMLGDEVLLAPVVAPGVRRSLHLPRGLWTDLRTNVEYMGNRAIEVDAPTGQVPAFARNGAILPLARNQAMELHYFPSLGGEFFLWEPSRSANSQFHAAPAGDFTRVEIESQVERTYEWVIHHTKRPSKVEEGAASYQPVRQRSSLKPGAWWHDRARHDLHIVVHANAGDDKIVNISFSYVR